MKLNQTKVIRAWCMYDWANSVYSLTITTAIFPIYFLNVTKSEALGEDVIFLGFRLPNSVLYDYALSFSFLIVAIILPLLSGIADYTGRKKLFLRIFAYIGSFACAGLFWYDSSNLFYGVLMFVFASIGYSGSLVFYDSFLPEIVTEDRYDRVSAQGYSYGYIGSVLLLIGNLVMILKPDLFGITDPLLPAKISFLSVGIWWFGFTHIPLYFLPKNPYNKKNEGHYLTRGYQELQKVWRTLPQLKDARFFLIAFFFFQAGVQTVMYMASLFGEKELGLETSQLISTVLIIQLVAIGGAYLFARISERRGNKFSLVTMIIIWVVVAVSAYFIYTPMEFYILAFVVGMIMGGIQALSRATYSKLLPEDTNDHASYFGFFDVTFYLSIVTGIFSFGLVEHFTGSMRFSAIILSIYFLIGLYFMLKVNVGKRVRLDPNQK